MKKYICICLFPLILISCTPKVSKNLIVFEQNNNSSIQKGLSTTDIEIKFGKPDKIYKTTFGEKTELPWEGLVYEYQTIQNPLYQYEKIFLTNIFVFIVDDKAPILNYWNFEYVYNVD